MSNPRKALGRRAEKQIAEKAVEAGLRSSVQPLSGILSEFPNDVVIQARELGVQVLVEAKVRTAQIHGGEKHITINLDWLKGVVSNALRMGMAYGSVVFRAKGSSDFYVLMRYEDFLWLHKLRDVQAQKD